MTTVKLPKPAHTHKWNHNPTYDVNFYTESQLRQALRDALEQAAQMCEEKHWTWHMGDTSGPKECAIAIRKMIGEIK